MLLTGLGSVEGKEDVARDGTRYYSFLGIPYLEPPLAELRLVNTHWDFNNPLLLNIRENQIFQVQTWCSSQALVWGQRRYKVWKQMYPGTHLS